MIAAFGAFAREYARGLGDLEAIVCEPAELTAAYLEAVRRRERGAAFYGMVLLDEPRSSYTYRLAAGVIGAVADYDLQAVALDQLAAGTVTVDGRSAAEHWELAAELRIALNDFYGLCDAMLVRSYAEYERLAELFLRALRPVERVLVEPAVPAVQRIAPARPGVVVWAPRRPAEHATLHAFGLREFFGDVLCVTADVVADEPRVRSALASAACVVCVEPSDPGDAVAFARLGYGVVAPRTAGAHEFVRDVVTWDGRASTLQHAVAIALARPAAVRAPAEGVPRAPQAPPAPEPHAELPLVSVVCPTYNRPQELRTMLAAMAAQSYPNIEVVVVNDAGAPVADVVAEFPAARLIDLPENRGSSDAMEIGLAAARGDYIQLMADDDLLYPDHVERLMYALLRSGASIAHGSGFSRIVERQRDGTWRTRGLGAITFTGTTTPSEALVAVPMYFHQLLVRRTVFVEAGWFRNDIALCDQELLLRLAQRYTFVYVDHVTSEFRDHTGGQGKLYDHVAEQLMVYDQLHPAPGRPVIAERRALAMEGVRQRIPGQPAFTPVIRLNADA